MKNTPTYIIILSVLALIFSCGEKDKKAQLEELKKQQSEIKQQIAMLEKELASEKGDLSPGEGFVGTTLVTFGSFEHKIEVQAKVEGDQNVNVSPQMPGNISRIAVKAGDAVQPGTLLVELENSVLQKTLSELQTSREFAAVMFQKQKSLWDQKIGTEVQYLQAKNNLASIDKKVETVMQQLDMTRVKSPIYGTVDALDLKIGQMFAPGMPGIRVVNFSNLKVKADLAEAYISKVSDGDSVEVYFPDLKTSTKAVISYSGKVIDPLNRTFDVEVTLNGNSMKLHPNQVAVLRIIDYKNEKTVVLPMDVVQSTPEGSYVFAAIDNKAVRKNVTIGKTYNGKIEVLTGISEGDLVVTSGYQDLMDGQKISQ